MGLEAARAAGCATLAVATTSGAGELTADAVVGTLDEVGWAIEQDGIHVHSRLSAAATGGRGRRTRRASVGGPGHRAPATSGVEGQL